MKTLSCLLGFLFVLLLENRGQEEFRKVRLVTYQCNDGDRIFELDEARVRMLPTWDPESETPAPISLRKAIEIGKAAIKRRDPKVEQLEITSTSLDDMVAGKRLGRWYYKLSFVGKRDGKRVYSCGFQAIVLLDGSSVEPVLKGPKQNDAP